MQSWLEQARTVSGLTVEECARALYQSNGMFLELEENPGALSINELRVLMKLFNSEGKQLVWSALNELKP